MLPKRLNTVHDTESTLGQSGILSSHRGSESMLESIRSYDPLFPEAVVEYAALRDYVMKFVD